MVLLPGVVGKLPDHVACQAVNLLYHTGELLAVRAFGVLSWCCVCYRGTAVNRMGAWRAGCLTKRGAKPAR